MKRIATYVLVVLAIAAGTTAGQEPPTNAHAAVTVKLSTLGVGLDVAVPVLPRVHLRGGFNMFGLSHDFDADGISLNAHVKMRSLAAGVDWFPFGGSFHISPGVLLYNGNEVSAKAPVAGGQSFSLGDEDLFSNPANPIAGTASIAFSGAAPTLMFGRGNLMRGHRRWSIPFGAGVVFSRAPRA